MIKLVIFDLDGTLIDSIEDIRSAFNHAVAPLGLPPKTTQEMKDLVGSGISYVIERVLGDGLKGEKNAVLDRFVAYYADHLVDETSLCPGVTETLTRLNGSKMAVVTNKRKGLSDQILDKLDIAHFFVDVLGSDSVKEKKPSPVPILHLLDKYSLQPEEALIIGDSENDIAAGRGAGTSTVALTSGYRALEALREADFIIDDIRELPGIVERL